MNRPYPLPTLAAIAVLGLAAVPVGHAQSAPAYFDLKPAGHTSYICANGDNSFTSDPSFAGYAAGALISNGVARVKDAEFVFESCYGGGFLSTLSTSLGSTVPWVGGAGGRYDQTVSGNNSGGLYVLPLNSSLAADYQANGAGSSTPFVNELNYAHDNDSAGRPSPRTRKRFTPMGAIRRSSMTWGRAAAIMPSSGQASWTRTKRKSISAFARMWTTCTPA